MSILSQAIFLELCLHRSLIISFFFYMYNDFYFFHYSCFTVFCHFSTVQHILTKHIPCITYSATEILSNDNLLKNIEKHTLRRWKIYSLGLKKISENQTVRKDLIIGVEELGIDIWKTFFGDDLLKNKKKKQKHKAHSRHWEQHKLSYRRKKKVCVWGSWCVVFKYMDHN